MRNTTTHASRDPSQSGFTLVEMIVSVGLFAIVSIICISALLSLVAADRKAQALQTSMNNLNLSIDDLVRNARMGTQYHCGLGGFLGDGSDDCTGGGTAFTFTCNSQMAGCAGNQRWEFSIGPVGGCPANAICESTDGGASWLPVTGPDVTITNLTFYVIGTKPGCDSGAPGTSCVPLQPRVIIVIVGSAGVGSSCQSQGLSCFHLEANAVQRVLDL